MLFSVGDLVFDNQSCQWLVTIGRSRLELPPTPRKVLWCLALNFADGGFVDDAAIQKYVYGDHTRGSEVVSNYVNRIRGVLQRANSIVSVQTMYKSGWRLLVTPTEFVPCSKIE